MSKTTGEEEAPNDRMGGRRAEIDTKKRRVGVTETASQSESSLIGHCYLEKCKVDGEQTEKKRLGRRRRRMMDGGGRQRRKMRFLGAEVSTGERGLPLSLTS
ncbi:unnamed protein product [Pleuronectes platessa]|uniref:Uncharacterized protein n=1 Tax=Pleuronectes platessa TaxID=8262 RepID=A0A9N7YC87_PLEPL|nr:unnamed protein product [Pleuronectes platessa]